MFEAYNAVATDYVLNDLVEFNNIDNIWLVRFKKLYIKEISSIIQLKVELFNFKVILYLI